MEHTSPGRCFTKLEGWYSSRCVRCCLRVCAPQEKGFLAGMDNISLVPHATTQWVSSAQVSTSLTKREYEKGQCLLNPFINNQKHTTQVTLSERPPLLRPRICRPQQLTLDGTFQPGWDLCPTQQFCPSPSSATHQTETHRN